MCSLTPYIPEVQQAGSSDGEEGTILHLDLGRLQLNVCSKKINK